MEARLAENPLRGTAPRRPFGGGNRYFVLESTKLMALILPVTMDLAVTLTETLTETSLLTLPLPWLCPWRWLWY